MAGEILVNDLVLVLVTGLIGGFVHDAAQGGFAWWGWDTTVTPNVFKPGFIGDLIVGAGAAFVTYGSTIATATSVTQLQLVVLAFTSGIGGSAILMAHVNGTDAARFREKLIALKQWP
jgi:hypothetical protein